MTLFMRKPAWDKSRKIAQRKSKQGTDFPHMQVNILFQKSIIIHTSLFQITNFHKLYKFVSYARRAQSSATTWNKHKVMELNLT